MKIFYNWEDIEGRVSDLCQKLKHESFEAVYGVPRGGLIVAVLVSHKLGIPLITDLKNMYGKKIVIGMGAGSISNWMRKLPKLM